MYGQNDIFQINNYSLVPLQRSWMSVDFCLVLPLPLCGIAGLHTPDVGKCGHSMA